MEDFGKLIQPGGSIDRRVSEVLARKENLLKEKFKVNEITHSDELDANSFAELTHSSRSQSMPIA